jgi:hypothetical protein
MCQLVGGGAGPRAERGQPPRGPRAAGAASRRDVRADHPGVGGECPGALVVNGNKPPCGGAGRCALHDSRLGGLLRQCHPATERLLAARAVDLPRVEHIGGDVPRCREVLPAADPARARRTGRAGGSRCARWAGRALRPGRARGTGRAAGSRWAGRAQGAGGAPLAPLSLGAGPAAPRAWVASWTRWKRRSRARPLGPERHPSQRRRATAGIEAIPAARRSSAALSPRGCRPPALKARDYAQPRQTS